MGELIRRILEVIRDILTKIIQVDPHYPEGTIIISCDGSILKNPGGRCSVGVVISVPGNEFLELSEFTPGTTNNDAEFDAVYLGLSEVLRLLPSNLYSIQIESDSKLVVETLKGNWKLKEDRLRRKRDHILSVVQLVEKGVVFKWRKRNSTVALKRANDLAQLKNGVKVH